MTGFLDNVIEALSGLTQPEILTGNESTLDPWHSDWWTDQGPQSNQQPKGALSGTDWQAPDVAIGTDGALHGGPGMPPTLHYRNPLRGIQNLRAARIDQGVDYAGSGHFYAAGAGVVIQYRASGSGWPGGAYIAYKLTQGPARGKVIYVAENLTLNPNLRVGSIVTPSTSLGMLHDAYPFSETGWATPDGAQPLAKVTGGYAEGQLTAAGQDFSQFMHHLGAPAGLPGGRGVVGAMGPGWPNWQNLAREAVTPPQTPSAGRRAAGTTKSPADAIAAMQAGPPSFQSVLDGLGLPAMKGRIPRSPGAGARGGPTNARFATAGQLAAAAARYSGVAGAERWASDPRLWYIIKGESGLTPDAGWKAIVEAAQTPNAQGSSAFGIGQFEDGTWDALGVKKTSNPYLQFAYIYKYIDQHYGGSLAAAYEHKVQTGWW